MSRSNRSPITLSGGRLRLAVQLVPKAATDRILGLIDDGHGGRALKAAVRAPPESGRANAALCELLARHFAVPLRDLAIVSGHGHRRKVIEFVGDPAILRAAIGERLSGAERKRD